MIDTFKYNKIKEMWDSGNYTMSEIGKEFGCTKQRISQIVRRINYLEIHPKKEDLSDSLIRVNGKIDYKASRLKAIHGYGDKCSNCGETRYKELIFHHRNGDGRQHLWELYQAGYGHSSNAIVRWAIENNYPDRLVLLCKECHENIHTKYILNMG